jgi:hypothetical protein
VPGASVSVGIKVTAPLETPACAFRNDAQIIDADGETISSATAFGYLPASALQNEPSLKENCRPVLSIDKKLDPAQPCTVDAAKQTITCGFVVSVTNTGSPAYTGRAVGFADEMDPGSTLEPVNAPPYAPLACEPPMTTGGFVDGKNLEWVIAECRNPVVPPPPLEAGASLSFNLKATSPLRPDCLLSNAVWTVAFVEPGTFENIQTYALVVGVAPNGTPGCQPFTPPPPQHGRSGHRPLLQLSKTSAGGDCTVAERAIACRYLVAVRNIGQARYRGPLAIQEMLPAGATLAFAGSGPATCDPSALTCTNANVTIEPGAAQGFLILVTAPLTPTCELKNEVRLIEPGGAIVVNASASATGHATGCPPPPPVCSDPARAKPDGSCCPTGTVWSRERNACVTGSATQITPGPYCPEGEYWDGNECVTCGPDQHWNGAQECIICRRGTHWNGAQCVADAPATTCPPPAHWDGQECVTCGPNQHWDGRQCVNDVTPPPCTAPRHWDGHQCVTCRSDQTWNGSQCVNNSDQSKCLSFQHWDGHQCVGRDQHWDGTQCVRNCPADQHWDGAKCVNNVTTCPIGQHAVGNNCVSNCPSNQHWDRAKCVANVPTCGRGQHAGGNRCVDNCRSGQHWDGSTCVKNAPPTCRSGEHWNGARCVPNAPTPRPPTQHCPPNWHSQGGRCVPNPRR